jgi:D-serine deaminase-like pyridoxal phosphate-dependent protein
MDADYARNHTDAPFEQSLTLLATVISLGGAPAGTPALRAIVDVGLKAHSVDSGMPVIGGDVYGNLLPGLEYGRPSDEHGILVAREGGRLPGLGTKLHLIPGHVDPTVNLHDWIVCVRDGRVEDVWPVAARGAMW